MCAAKIVVRKMQIHSSPKVIKLSRKPIRQASKAAKLHSDRQVVPLHVAGRDVLRIRISAADFGYNLRDLSWGLAFISLLAVVSIELRKLREIRVASEGFLDGLAVEDVSIGSELDSAIIDAAPTIAHKGLGVLAGTLADQERGNQLLVRVQSDEDPLVPEVCRIVLSAIACFFHQECPDFIALDTAARQLAHLFVHQLFAAFASDHQQPHDGVPVMAP